MQTGILARYATFSSLSSYLLYPYILDYFRSKVLAIGSPMHIGAFMCEPKLVVPY